MTLDSGGGGGGRLSSGPGFSQKIILASTMCEQNIWLHPWQTKLSALYPLKNMSAFFLSMKRKCLCIYIHLSHVLLQFLKESMFRYIFVQVFLCPCIVLYLWCPGLDGEMSVAKFGLHWRLLKLLRHIIYQLYVNLHVRHIRSASAKIRKWTNMRINMVKWCNIHKYCWSLSVYILQFLPKYDKY